MSAPSSGCSCPTSMRNKRGLARAVGADHADDAAAREHEREVVDEQPVAVALAEVVGLDHLVAETRTGRDRDLELRVAPLGRLGLRDQLVERVDARLALGLAGARRHADPLELAGERAPAGLVDLLLLREPLVLLLEPARVVALPRNAVAAVELEDPARDVVEEVAVVGDRDDGAVVLVQVALEPRDRLGVEVVGGLVEQQQVGLREQQAGTARPGGAHRPTAW